MLFKYIHHASGGLFVPYRIRAATVQFSQGYNLPFLLQPPIKDLLCSDKLLIVTGGMEQTQRFTDIILSNGNAAIQGIG